MPTNALLDRNNLNKVGLIRLAGHRPLLGSTLDLLRGNVTVDGGFEFDGRPITALKLAQIDCAIERLGVESLAICGAFSCFYPEQELEVCRYIKERYPNIDVTLSHQIGGIGMIERENAAIVNSALKKSMREGFSKLKEGIDIPLILTQNNGSMITLEEAIERPILTLSSGPTNSFIGAAKLAGLDDAVIVDIGGTSTDVGVVRKGGVRRSLSTSSIGGIPLNFPMPDLLSIPIGGGSTVSFDPPAVGPASCGKRLLQEAVSFGGSRLTLTDIALSEGHLEIEGATRVEVKDAKEIFSFVFRQIEVLVSKMEGEMKGLPIVLVGGGAALLPRHGRFLVPEHYGVANAFGAALAEESYTIDRVLPLEMREDTLARLEQELVQELDRRGCRSIKIDNIEITPYTYLPGHLARYQLSGRGEKNNLFVW